MMKRWTIRARSVGWVVFLACLLLLGSSVLAQPAPPGQTETDRIIQAHREVQSAVVEVRYGVYFSRADETEFVTSDYRLVFDRPSSRLRLDRPGYTLISDGTDIYLTADAMPGRHLRMPINGDLTYERLLEVFPDLADPTPPVLVYLLSDDPVSRFVAEGAGGPTPLAPTPTQRQLDFPLAQGRQVQSFDKTTRLIEQLLIDIKIGQPDLEAVRFHYGIQWSVVDQLIDEAEFELDVKQSHEFTTLAAFLSPNGGNAQPGPGGQGGGVAAGGSLVGMPLPEIELEQLGTDNKVKLSELDKGVVILECFASWSKTSVLDLPALAEFKAWCKEKDHDVQIHAIAVGDQAEHMTKWLDALEKTAKKELGLSVLMDTSTEAAMAMKLPTVPRTLIVVDGRVVDVFGGVKPTYLDDLKEGLPGWLETVKSDEEPAEQDEPGE